MKVFTALRARSLGRSRQRDARRKWRNVAALAAILALIGGCSAQPTFEVDYDTDYAFSEVKTYRWYDDMVDSRQADYRQYNSSDKRIRDAVAGEMRRHSIRESQTQYADIWINYSVSKQQQTVQRTTGYDRGVHGGASVGTYGSAVGIGYSSGPSTKVIKEGTAVMDIIDVRSKQVVWRGVAEGRLKDHMTIPEKQKATIEVVRELFKDFPPKN